MYMRLTENFPDRFVWVSYDDMLLSSNVSSYMNHRLKTNLFEEDTVMAIVSKPSKFHGKPVRDMEHAKTLLNQKQIAGKKIIDMSPIKKYIDANSHRTLKYLI